MGQVGFAELNFQGFGTGRIILHWSKHVSYIGDEVRKPSLCSYRRRRRPPRMSVHPSHFVV